MKIIIVLALAILVTIFTLLGSVEVYEKSDLFTISCGQPLHFITQDQGWRDPPYPWKVPCFASPLESPTKFHLELFVFDVAFFFLLILAAYYYWKSDHEENTKEKTR